MTDHHDEYGEILRRALHAEADTVVPADGLERIRTRIRERPPRFSLSWFTTGWVRPGLAVAAALVLAALVVSAPPAISTLTSVGGKDPAGGGGQGQSSTSVAVQPGSSGESSQEPPRPEKSGDQISATISPSSKATPGVDVCGRPDTARGTPAPSQTGTPASQVPATCPSPVTTTSTPPEATTPPPPVEPPPPSTVPVETQSSSGGRAPDTQATP
jgi:hypothetical protein